MVCIGDSGRITLCPHHEKARMNKWLAFWLLGLIWGSSFLLIRIGVESLTPFQVVFIRTAIAAVGMNLVLLSQGQRLPLTWKKMFPLIVIGIGNTSLPFALISWGEQSIPSSLAGVLQSTAVFFTMIVAHLSFTDEKITVQKAVGLLVGFVGVALLATRSVSEEGQVTPAFWGAMAVVAASFCYATFTVYSRQHIKEGYTPIMVSTGAMTVAAITSGAAMLVSPLLGGPPNTPLADVPLGTLGAVVLLGLLNTFIAYLMYYNIVRDLGAARSSMVTYIVPAVSVFLGALVLSEAIDARLVFGTMLIFAGIAVVNLKVFAWLNRRRAAAAL